MPRLSGLGFIASLMTAFLIASMPERSTAEGPALEPVVEASTDGGTVEVTIRYDGVLANVPLASEPLADCSFRGPVTADEVRALLEVSVAARVSKLDDDAQYAVVSCQSQRFDGAASAVWPIDDDPPTEVVEILAQTAVARLTIPRPVPRSAPDGTETPFLVHLPVWFWLDATSWQARSAVASLGPLGASATATARPAHTRWTPGDGSPSRFCPDAGTPWNADSAAAGDLGAPSGCGHGYASVSPSDLPIELSVTAVYDLDVSCAPVRICSGVDLPSSLGITSSRPVYVTQVRGVITR